MQLIRNILFLFCVGSMIGWLIELFYRRLLNKEKQWLNPGFLIGPYLPLYGFGLDVLYLLASFEKHISIADPVLRTAVVILSMTVMMTVLEYITGIIFITKMKVKLWDYSDCWGNLQGIICPLYSFYWGILAAIYYFLLHSRFTSLLNTLTQSFVYTFLIGFYYGVFVIDLVYSAQLLVRLRAFAKEHNIVVRLEELKTHLTKKAAERKKKAKFLFVLSLSRNEPNHLEDFYNEIKAAREELKAVREAALKKIAEKKEL